MLPLALFLASFAIAWAAYHLVLPATWSGARRTLSVLARALLHRQPFASWYERRAPRLRTLHPYRPLAAVAAGGFVAAALVGTAFLELAEMVQERSEALERFDYGAWAVARELRTPGATAFFTAWTLIGTPVGLGILVLSVAAVLLARGRRWLPVFLVATPLGGWALNSLLKAIFARARPDLTLALSASHSYSFPSGHAMMSVAAFGALAYAALRLASEPWMRSAALAFASCAAAAVALSRVYLGVHWVSDIVAGAAAGLVWLATTVAVYELRRRLRVIRRGRSTS
jgi:undecaprenyl-diphosphatase